jgi:outer membrane receptor protein involved in Fe transport
VLFGTVRDADSGDRLAGANVLVVGTTLGASTDLDGKFRIEGIPAGTHEVRVSFTGYRTKTVPAVLIKADDSEKLNVRLEPESGAAASFVIDDLVVTGERVLSTEIALITERMKAITIGDAISAERISKSPDGSSSDVLKRVTGLSVMDNKFVYVRGTTDRYSVTWLDGVATSSTDTDVDRRSFTFDILPASLLASAVVVKTATPDLPGDFTGGLVQLNTRDIPEGRQLSASASSGYDEETSNRALLRSQGSDTDWQGRDDGARELPAFEESPGNNYNALARELPNSWPRRETTAPLSGSYSLSYGDRYDLGRDDGNHVVGVIAGVKYSNSYEHVDFLESPHDPGGALLYEKRGTRDRYKVVWSGLLNVAYSPAPKHRLSARGIYVRDARDQVTHGWGWISENASQLGGESWTIEWDERSRAGLQVGGSHEFGRRLGVKFDWRLFGSEATASEPDRKQADFLTRADGTMSLGENSRSWSQLDERTRGFRADLTWPFGDSSAKVGAYIEDRKREYTTDSFFTDTGTIRPPNLWLRVAGIDSIFTADNYGPKKLFFRVKSAYTGEYESTHRLDAYYGMVDHPFSLWTLRMRLAGGARVERSDQRAEALTKEGSEEPILSRIDKTDVLPSASLTYMPAERVNVRLAYYQSVNRPELREMADVTYHDFNEGVNVVGNPDLKRALIRNYDARLEVFAGADEIVALSYFYKDLEDAIELKLIPSSDYRYVRTWFNSPHGKNHGFEVELRKSLSFAGDFLSSRGVPGGFLRDLTIIGNYSRAYSEVEYLYEWTWEDEEGNAHTGREMRTRPLQGQSPWALNLAVLYEHPRSGTSVSLLYNKIARRLHAVSGAPQSDLWQESREVLDLAVNQTLFDHWEVKLTAQNLTGSDDVKTMGPERIVHTKESRGTSYSLSIGYKL